MKLNLIRIKETPNKAKGHYFKKLLFLWCCCKILNGMRRNNVQTELPPPKDYCLTKFAICQFCVKKVLTKIINEFKKFLLTRGLLSISLSARWRPTKCCYIDSFVWHGRMDTQNKSFILLR